jgi:hypothetical protein
MDMELAVWAPGLPLPVEYASAEIYDNCLQTYVATSSSVDHGHLVQFSSATPNDPMEKASQEFQVDFHNMEMNIYSNPIHVFEKAACEFKFDVDMMMMKMHRYPVRIRSFGELYTAPMMVSIGPYHHGRDHLKAVEGGGEGEARGCLPLHQGVRPPN